jgi:hypothetical protein
MLSTFDLLELTSFDQLLFIENIFYLCYNTSFLNEKVNSTEPSPQLLFPGVMFVRKTGTCPRGAPSRKYLTGMEVTGGDKCTSKQWHSFVVKALGLHKKSVAKFIM